MIQEYQGHIAWVDACNHGFLYVKSWPFARNNPQIHNVAGLCRHNIKHLSLVGKKEPDGIWTSTLSAEYPASLAQQITQHMSFRLTSTGRAQQFLDPRW